MIKIVVPDMNDSLSEITLSQKNYKIRFTYNSKYDFWSFGIKDADGSDIISNTKIVPNFPLLHYYADSRLPRGIFGCISTQQKIGRQAFNDNMAEFVYIPYSEVQV